MVFVRRREVGSIFMGSGGKAVKGISGRTVYYDYYRRVILHGHPPLMSSITGKA
jgi:hypothetical protein